MPKFFKLDDIKLPASISKMGVVTPIGYSRMKREHFSQRLSLHCNYIITTVTLIKPIAISPATKGQNLSLHGSWRTERRQV